VSVQVFIPWESSGHSIQGSQQKVSPMASNGPAPSDFVLLGVSRADGSGLTVHRFYPQNSNGLWVTLDVPVGPVIFQGLIVSYEVREVQIGLSGPPQELREERFYLLAQTMTIEPVTNAVALSFNRQTDLIFGQVVGRWVPLASSGFPTGRILSGLKIRADWPELPLVGVSGDEPMDDFDSLMFEGWFEAMALSGEGIEGVIYRLENGTSLFGGQALKFEDFAGIVSGRSRLSGKAVSLMAPYRMRWTLVNGFGGSSGFDVQPQSISEPLAITSGFWGPGVTSAHDVKWVLSANSSVSPVVTLPPLNQFELSAGSSSFNIVGRVRLQVSSTSFAPAAPILTIGAGVGTLSESDTLNWLQVPSGGFNTSALRESRVSTFSLNNASSEIVGGAQLMLSGDAVNGPAGAISSTSFRPRVEGALISAGGGNPDSQRLFGMFGPFSSGESVDGVLRYPLVDCRLSANQFLDPHPFCNSSGENVLSLRLLPGMDWNGFSNL